MNELNMTVSPVCHKDGKSYAFVQFIDDKRVAEGKIPECKIISNEGFSEDEIVQLELYLKTNLKDLKKMASQQNMLQALMKNNQ